MIDGPEQLPLTWLTLLGGRDVAGWLSAFAATPDIALDHLLWDDFYFGPLNLVERAQLLAGWLDLLGNVDSFASTLDDHVARWIDRNWGRIHHPAELLASAWSCALGVVEFSSRLPAESRLVHSATALRQRFGEHHQFLASFSTAPGADPLGQYLMALAEFQTDRSLAPLWHHMCDLPDSVPFYHARCALLGLRRLPSNAAEESGTLRREIVTGLQRVARAFDRLVEEHTLTERAARRALDTVAKELSSAYPKSPLWWRHASSSAIQVPARTLKWLQESIREIAAPPRTTTKASFSALPSPNPNWGQRSRTLAARVSKGDFTALDDLKQLFAEERRYAESSGDAYDIVHSLRNAAIRVVRFNPALAILWAEEALAWAPEDDYSWNTMRTVLLRQHRINDALRIAWIAWKRFPSNVVAHTGLSEALRRARRMDAAEIVYRRTITRFPDNPFARTGLAEVLTEVGRDQEALDIYRESASRFETNIVVRTGLATALMRFHLYDEAENEFREILNLPGADSRTYVTLAYLLLRRGDADRAVVDDLVKRALLLDPHDRNAVRLRKQLSGTSADPEDELRKLWLAAADRTFADLADHADVGSVDEDQGLPERLQVADLPLDISIDNDDPASEEPPLLDRTHGGSAAHRFQASRDSRDSEQKEATERDASSRPAKSPDRVSRVGSPIEMPHSYHQSKSRLRIAALAAEAYFYRVWASDAAIPSLRTRQREVAEELASLSEPDSYNSQIVTERAALAADFGDLDAANAIVEAALRHQASSLALLHLRSHFQRLLAQNERRPFTDQTVTALSSAPRRLKELQPTLVPLYYLQKGLAALALSDGSSRLNEVAAQLTNFRRSLGYRVLAEKRERDNARDFNVRTVPGFYEWMETHVSRALFGSISKSDQVNPADVPTIERALRERRFDAITIEDAFVDRLVYAHF